MVQVKGRMRSCYEFGSSNKKRALYFAKAKYKEKSEDTLPNELDTAYVGITTKFWVSRGRALGIPLTKGDLGGWLLGPHILKGMIIDE
ncbi:hypothetical protein PGLA_23560 [Paenibacillus glacialis]|uniref:Uncharacterized protein n=1 Tax=Paenibacillus glacialis TaxID=494026 RepID=A0A162PQ58_9BACL|nr:hypothetical protein PGLA_23560 [Paenibacillus glacialis]